MSSLRNTLSPLEPVTASHLARTITANLHGRVQQVGQSHIANTSLLILSDYDIIVF